jgi:hypothetical protein
MSRKNSNGGLLAATLVALALTACGSIQGASPARAGVPANGGSSDIHLVEFDANDSRSGTAGAGLLGGQYPAPQMSYLSLPSGGQHSFDAGHVDGTNTISFGSIGTESADGTYLSR